MNIYQLIQSLSLPTAGTTTDNKEITFIFHLNICFVLTVQQLELSTYPSYYLNAGKRNIQFPISRSVS